MNEIPAAKPRLGISACLLGQPVRFDSGHKRDHFLTDTFGSFVEWMPVCPELEAGMGVPRETVQLVNISGSTKMLAAKSGKDWTAAMGHFAQRRINELRQMDLSGYVFKKDSPSCGLERVRIFNAKGVPARNGRGLFAAHVCAAMPLLPVEEEGRLNDPTLRENFIERVFAYHRWQELNRQRKSIKRLIDFHTQHKFLLLAHSEVHYRQLGRVVASAKRQPLGAAYDAYGEKFMSALSVAASARKHANVLDHMMGYFTRQLTPMERLELLEIIHDFRRQLVPLVVPLTLIHHYVRKYQIDYLLQQVYLNPSPKELMLRNHV